MIININIILVLWNLFSFFEEKNFLIIYLKTLSFCIVTTNYYYIGVLNSQSFDLFLIITQNSFIFNNIKKKNNILIKEINI